MSGPTTNSMNGATTTGSTRETNGTTHKNTNSITTSSTAQVQYCGPYKLEKTLGKGQTGKQNVTKKYIKQT